MELRIEIPRSDINIDLTLTPDELIKITETELFKSAINELLKALGQMGLMTSIIKPHTND